ncbi:TetR/AcrR family transcriptional regulator [Defluviimonas sp. SAOS-178_SWC]|uniref:TetR/AcrR family transcriptional regulator n=1 Tax=Defluviimonas sp. SAOS-178_SWC TaxID=3121287 RepID=UPI0032221769
MSTHAPKRKRTPLSAERIATEAMALVDEGGIDALSFRTLAARLKCQAMSLYHYYPSKQHLIDALINICLAEIEIPGPGLPLRERLHRFCLNYRATVLRHPGFAAIFTSHRLNHREGLATLDACVRMFDGAGVSYERKASLFRVLSYYITGAVLDEALGYAKGASAADPVPLDEARRDFPEIMGIGAYFGRENHLKFYETGLGVLLDWIEADLTKG